MHNIYLKCLAVDAVDGRTDGRAVVYEFLVQCGRSYEKHTARRNVCVFICFLFRLFCIDWISMTRQASSLLNRKHFLMSVRLNSILRTCTSAYNSTIMSTNLYSGQVILDQSDVRR